MLCREELTNALNTHKVAYQVMSMVHRDYTFKFDDEHADSSPTQLGAAWLEENSDKLSAIPDLTEVDKVQLANMILSFAHTTDSQGASIRKHDMFYRTVSCLHRRARVRKHDRMSARASIIAAVRDLAFSLEFPILESEIEGFVDEHENTNIALARYAYARELIRRTRYSDYAQFYSMTGYCLIAHWRDMAHDNKGRVIESFALDTELILKDEKCIAKLFTEYAQRLN